MLNFDRSTVKHALQNTQNDCYQWLSHSFRVHQNRFRPTGGAYSAPLGPLVGLRGTLILRGRRKEARRGGDGRGGKERAGRRKGMRRERGWPRNANSWIRRCYRHANPCHPPIPNLSPNLWPFDLKVPRTSDGLYLYRIWCLIARAVFPSTLQWAGRCPSNYPFPWGELDPT